jgi:hypothetical protein
MVVLTLGLALVARDARPVSCVRQSVAQPLFNQPLRNQPLCNQPLCKSAVV